MVRRVGLGLGILLLAVVGYFALRGDDEVSGEAKYDGVHLCSPSQQEAATVAAGQGGAEPGQALDGELDASRTEGPLFAQNSPAWGNEEYDHGGQQNIGCGATIAQCGCAMTSVATILNLFGTMSLPNGELNPSGLNAWFNEGAQFTGDGWVSHGYSYGNVVWTAVNNIASSTPGSKPMRFAGWGGGSEAEIRDQLARGNGVVVEVPGHYIAAVGLQDLTSAAPSSNVVPVSLQEPTILINDPYYAERTTLDSYAGLVQSIRIYEPGEDLSAVMITVPSNQRVEITDSEGRVVGTLGGDTPQDAQSGASTDIPGAQVQFEEAWRDPTCTERAPEAGDGTISVFIPGPQAGSYGVEVLNPEGDDTSVAVYIYDPDGALTMLSNSGGSELEFSFNIDATGGGSSGGPSSPPVTPTPETPTPEPEEEEDEAVADPAGPVEDVAGVTDETDEPITEPSTEPSVETSVEPPVTPTTPVPAPATVLIDQFNFQLFGTSMDPGQTCRTVLSWKLSGDPKGKVEVIRNQLVVFTGTVGTGTGMYTDAFSAGPKSYRLRTTNSAGVIQETLQPLNVQPFCLQSFTVTAGQDCGIDCGGYVYRYSWTIQGAVNGTVRVMEQVTNDGFLGPWTQVGNVSLSPSTFTHGAFIPESDFSSVCDPSRHQIFVTVNGVEVASPVRNLPGLTGVQTPACVQFSIMNYAVDRQEVSDDNWVFVHTWTIQVFDGPPAASATVTILQEATDESETNPPDRSFPPPSPVTSPYSYSSLLSGTDWVCLDTTNTLSVNLGGQLQTVQFVLPELISSSYCGDLG